ncbi:DUF6471 domain-containing protein [Parasphingopyxis algicola]|uniref:DUF6471 domain-containing protein n=1 Tax=Parasphingopyxis algicola TaxID=2026624 RepID=UPI001C408FF6|nr:DUF6471 domain-containing protein [Parasphingopyxis algicola]
MTYGIVVNAKSIVYGDFIPRWRYAMPVKEKEWEDKVKGLLKAELKRRNVTYAELVGKLADIGVMDSVPNIKNKVSRGKFTAVFFVQCLTAIGCETMRLD